MKSFPEITTPNPEKPVTIRLLRPDEVCATCKHEHAVDRHLCNVCSKMAAKQMEFECAIKFWRWEPKDGRQKR